MKIVIYLCFMILFSNFGFAQENLNSPEDRIHNFVQQKANPSEKNIDDYKKTLMVDMKSKWNLSFSEVILKFIVEKDGSISNLIVISEEWKPTENDMIQLNDLISEKGKWNPAKYKELNVRSSLNIKLIFQQ
ncbi:hypothetical protein EG240_02940 [Paenimyroides tangerinum]|uniref:TonB C-terminal domain-containing protein n=1 Tax=Paenimyroides tangerinum TaxID=2488728 RepID=A0A3P3WB14_9FLAO|nr:hypothetical protein [Paenimyroides tangerinum]RRJ92371.1 hypothetical protein EG240_02940 [Paenimyroides tangerinum]